VADIERLSALASDPDVELKRLESEIRASPSDARLRTYLFQLLALRGDWQRAISQLQVSAQLDPIALAMAKRCAPRCSAPRYSPAASSLRSSASLRRGPDCFSSP
jgi:protein involved in temperature-dependent protein secretion